jgi:amidophosphoribosyltransferase
MPTREELIGSSKSIEEIREYLGVDSLGYLSIDGMLSVVPQPREHFCAACFDGVYPVAVGEKERRKAMLCGKG